MLHEYKIIIFLLPHPFLDRKQHLNFFTHGVSFPHDGITKLNKNHWFWHSEDFVHNLHTRSDDTNLDHNTMTNSGLAVHLADLGMAVTEIKRDNLLMDLLQPITDTRDLQFKKQTEKSSATDLHLSN